MESMQQIAIALYQYIGRLCEIRQTPVTDIKRQPLSIEMDDWVVDEENICLHSRDRVDEQEENGDPTLLRVHKPEFTRCPALPDLLTEWIEPGWDDYRVRVQAKDILRRSEQSRKADGVDEVEGGPEEQDEKFPQPAEHFSDNPERIRLFTQWEKNRRDWVNQQEHIQKVRDLFSRFYDVRNLLIKDPDTYEFMIGNGILIDQRHRGFCHPVLLKKLSIKLVGNGTTLIISDAESDCELYTTYVNRIEGLNTEAILHIESSIKDNEIHPLDRIEGKNILKTLIHHLSDKGCYLDGDDRRPSRDDQFIMQWRPVFFVRKRIDGSIETVGRIIKSIEKGGEIPPSLVNILGGGSHNSMNGCSEVDGSLTSAFEPVPEILLPKPANQEQLDIAIQIEKHPAVLVQGPPGTGKTHTIANLLGHFLAQGKRVLVTSQTNKALRVLKDKVPEDIQPLCVAVLNDSNEDMERSINGIIEYMAATHSPTQIKREADELRLKREALQKELEEAKSRVFMIRNREFMPIAFQGGSYSPAQAARYISEHRDWLDLIPGRISPAEPFPITPDEANTLYHTNRILTAQEEEELESGLPDTAICMTAEELKEYLETEKTAETVLRGIGSQIGKDLAWMREAHMICDAATGEVFAHSSDHESIAALEALLDHYPEQLEYTNWIYRIIADSQRSGSRKEKWNRLLQAIDDTYQYSESVEDTLFGKAIKIQSGMPLSDLLTEYSQMLLIAQKKGSIGKPGVFTPKARKQAIESITVDGTHPMSYEQICIAIDGIKLQQMQAELGLLWDALMVPCGESAFAELGDAPEQICKGKREQIARFLTWVNGERLDLIDGIVKAGIDKGFTKRLEVNTGYEMDESAARMMLGYVMHQLPSALRAAKLLQRMMTYEQKRQQTIECLKGKTNSVVCRNLVYALLELNPDAYSAHLQVFISLKQKNSTVIQRRKLIDKIAVHAPLWAKELRERIGIHGNPDVPKNLVESWNCKQLDQIVSDIASASLSDAEKEVYRLTVLVRKATAELSQKMAWYHMIQRIHGNVGIQQALNGWKMTIKKIGKGTGKKAPMYRRQAKELMTKCQKAVPAWIMSVTKVMDTVDPMQTKFDVIIIDEASQCDVTAMALLYMAKKVIVVGDDEQVSPMAVGANEEQIQTIVNTYIRDKIPNWHLFGLKDSLYNIVAMNYRPLMLREHFRCVPEIIGYSNMLAYNYGIRPLRESGSVAVHPGIVPYRVQGRRKGKSKTNVEEAEMIVALLMACMDQPEYAKKTFGIVSLLGNDQVRLIDRILYERIDLMKREDRKILCGDASSFQGDERDVIFLSMVDSNEEDGPLKLTGEGVGGSTKQRYNVAVSRAKDQLWVVHSLDYTRDLKEGDIRRGLLEYAEDPYAHEVKVKAIERDSESIFEEEVAKSLVAAGYHIKQQWKVGAYRIDMVAIYKNKKIAIECDGERYHSSEEQLRSDIERQSVLERLDWRFIRIRGSEYFRDKLQTMRRVVRELEEYGIYPEKADAENKGNTSEDELLKRVKLRALQIRASWTSNQYSITEQDDSDTEMDAPWIPERKAGEYMQISMDTVVSDVVQPARRRRRRE